MSVIVEALEKAESSSSGSKRGKKIAKGKKGRFKLRLKSVFIFALVLLMAPLLYFLSREPMIKPAPAAPPESMEIEEEIARFPAADQPALHAVSPSERIKSAINLPA